MRSITGFTVAAVISTVSQVSAQGLNPSDVMNACRSDYLSYCAGVMPGGGRIIKCLSEQMPTLKPQCREAVIMGEICLPDYQRLCSSAKPGSEVVNCMKKQLGNLSSQCAKVISGNVGSSD